LKNRALI